MEPLSGALTGNPFAALTTIVAPAVLTNACSVLCLGTSNRIARVVDRSREVAKDLKWGYQYTHIREEKNSLDHDDRIEAFAGILAEFVRDIDRSPQLSAEMKRRQTLLDRIKNWGKRDARFAHKMVDKTDTRLWRR